MKKELYLSTSSISTTEQQRLEEIKRVIQSRQKNHEQSFEEIGNLLREAKLLLTKHGEWQSWIQNNTDFSLSKAERLMKAARFLQETAPELNLNFSQAYILSSLPSKDLNSFLAQTHWVDAKKQYMCITDISKRDLEIIVRNYIRNHSSKQGTGQSQKKPNMSADSKDSFTEQYEKIRSSLNQLVNLVEKDSSHSASNGLLIKSLCNLCTEILQKFPSEGLEEP